MPKRNPRQVERKLSILKDRERFDNRLRKLTWPSPTADIIFRLECLIQFNPNLNNRQIFNLAKISLK